MKVFKPVKICLKNGYSEEQIHWVPLIHFSFSIFFFFFALEGCVDEKGTTFCKTFIQDDADKKVYCSLGSNIFVSQANFVEFTQFACKATCGNC